MARLRDARILCFEPPEPGDRLGEARCVRPNILVYTLPPLPMGGIRAGFLQQRAWRRRTEFILNRMSRHDVHEPVLWLTGPEQAALIDRVPGKGLIYDCDRYWPDSLSLQEGALAAAADVVFTASPGLMDRLSPCNTNLVLLPNGVNYPMFARQEYDCPRELRGIEGPVLGWVGGLHRDLDAAPLELTARQHPEWTFVVTGPTKRHPRRPALERMPNVLLLGRLGVSELPDYLGRFDVCLALRREDDEGEDIIPGHIYQYLSTGKPVVTMVRPDEVEEFPDVIYGAHTPEEFSRLCARALTEDREWVSQRRRNYGKAAAWSARADAVIRVLEAIGLYRTGR
ncbi:MAG: glycosyltransferase family 1 protein [Clostridiales bacterium]|nr:glycosyltransferase family 1 protein [Clostridiales bacterium]